MIRNIHYRHSLMYKKWPKFSTHRISSDRTLNTSRAQNVPFMCKTSQHPKRRWLIWSLWDNRIFTIVRGDKFIKTNGHYPFVLMNTRLHLFLLMDVGKDVGECKETVNPWRNTSLPVQAVRCSDTWPQASTGPATPLCTKTPNYMPRRENSTKSHEKNDASAPGG